MRTVHGETQGGKIGGNGGGKKIGAKRHLRERVLALYQVGVLAAGFTGKKTMRR